MSDYRPTPLEQIFAIFGLKPMHVTSTAKRIAELLGMKEAISRQQLLRLRKGKAHPTDRKIFLLVATIRELTGYAIRAGDLFRLEPALAEGMPYLNPVSSPLPRGFTLPESTPPTDGAVYFGGSVFSSTCLNMPLVFDRSDVAAEISGRLKSARTVAFFLLMRDAIEYPISLG